MHISDVCKAVVHAITSRANGTFNIASGSAISFHDVARIVRDAIGDDVSIESVGAESNPPTALRCRGYTKLVSGIRQPSSLG